VHWLTEEEAGRLLKELPEHLAAMAIFILTTGLRQRNVSCVAWLRMSRVQFWHSPEIKKACD
jgi:hypothetical protein